MTKDKIWFILDRELPLRQNFFFSSIKSGASLQCKMVHRTEPQNNNSHKTKKMQDIRKTIKVKQPALSLFPIKMIAKQKGH